MRETVAIIGAGPYGLSMAAHLHGNSRFNIRIFGRAMSFWENMPKGMLLRSGWRASFIADPKNSLTLEAFQSATGQCVPQPVPLSRFLDYGRWFQRQTAPELDSRQVISVACKPKGFLLALQDGEELAVDRVIVATGIAPFSYVPKRFSGLPKHLATHSCEHADFSGFAGKEIAVIGGGQSALESAALLAETGATVHVYVRESAVHFLGWRRRIMNFKPLFKLLYSWTDVGPAGLSQLVSHPQYFRALPRRAQLPVARRCIRPAGASWLPARLENVRVHLNTAVEAAVQCDARLKLRLTAGTTNVVDHLIMGTGYRIDISKHPFLRPELLSSIRQCDGYPELTRNFESSVRGVYFLGAPAAWSFGPLMRFVAGTQFACGRLAASLAGK